VYVCACVCLCVCAQVQAWGFPLLQQIVHEASLVHV
jgi:hypothetical protein